MTRSVLYAVIMFALGAVGTYSLQEARKPQPVHAVGTGLAPNFELVAIDGDVVSLHGLRGRVVVLTFGFTRCGDICPVAMNKLTWIQDELGDAVGPDVQFVMITVDPVYDTTEVLAKHADQIGANPDGWSFLTGSPSMIETITQRYGVYATATDDDLVEHILLTSLIDRDGVIGTQYLGERFSAEEMLSDLRTLLAGDEIPG